MLFWTVLDMIFCQVKNSWIAVNAYRILGNIVMLDCGVEFEFYPTDSTAEIVKIVQKLYQEAVVENELD